MFIHKQDQIFFLFLFFNPLVLNWFSITCSHLSRPHPAGIHAHQSELGGKSFHRFVATGSIFTLYFCIATRIKVAETRTCLRRTNARARTMVIYRVCDARASSLNMKTNRCLPKHLTRGFL